MVVVLAIALYDKLSLIESFGKKLSGWLVNFFSVVNIIFIVLGVIIFFYILNKIYISLTNKKMKKERRSSSISFHKEKVKQLMRKYLNNKIKIEDYIEELGEALDDLPGFSELSSEGALLSSELTKSEETVIESEHENKVLRLRREKESLEKEIRLKKEYDREDILGSLNLSKTVFCKRELDKKEIIALLDEGYRQVNEYDVLEKRVIPVLVKRVGNHSVAHVFLVWSVKRLIESFGIEDVKECLTVDADLIFKFNKKKYAIEVELGSLLGKKEQLKNKIKDLNEKYPERWTFVVSHRDLLKKYKKFGVSCSRANVGEKLSKMLKIAHPSSAGVKR